MLVTFISQNYALLFSLVLGGISGNVHFTEFVKDAIYKVNQKILEPFQYIGVPVNPETLKFFLVTPANIDRPYQIDYYKPEIKGKCEGKIFFIVHGMFDGADALWIHDLTEVLLRKNIGVCSVLVDWSIIVANLNLAYTFAAAEKGGILIGEFINRILTEDEIPRENIMIISHSLGSQAVAFTSKALRSRGILLPLIVALDPGGLTFNFRPVSKRLYAGDADVVMAIHTDIRIGFAAPCGTIDFFPNNGALQPGCRNLKDDLIKQVSCDHLRAVEYFIEAVNVTGSFPARKCDSYDQYIRHQCNNNVLVHMGDLGTKENGRFYLRTNPEKPFSCQEDGAS